MRAIGILICNLTMVVAFSQPPTRFYSTYGGNGDDIGRDCIQTLDSNYVIAGSSSSLGNGMTDFYVLKIDANGQKIWESYLGGFGIDVGVAIAELPDSGFVITGYSNSFGAGGYDFLTIKIDKVGKEVWKRTYGGSDWDFANDVVFTTDSSIIIVGSYFDTGVNRLDGMVLKYDLAGNLLWSKSLGGTEDDEFKSVIVTNDSNLVMIGYTKSFGDANGDFYLCKMELDSDTIFTNKFGNLGKSYGTDIMERATNELVVVGAETYSSSPYTVSYMREYYSNGQLHWEYNFYASSLDEHWVSVTKSKFGTPGASYLRNVPVPGFESQGNIFLNLGFGMFPTIVNSFGGTQTEELFKHNGTFDGGYICVGRTNSFSGPDFDIFFIKLDSTIINYTSVVGLKEVDKINTNKPYVIYRELDNVTVAFENEVKSRSIEIYTIEGILLEQFDCIEKTCRFDINKYGDGIILMKIQTNAGASYIEKIIAAY